MLVMLSNSNLGTYFVDNDDMFRRRLWYLILDLLLLTKIGMTILDISQGRKLLHVANVDCEFAKDTVR